MTLQFEIVESAILACCTLRLVDLHDGLGVDFQGQTHPQGCWVTICYDGKAVQ